MYYCAVERSFSVGFLLAVKVVTAMSSMAACYSYLVLFYCMQLVALVTLQISCMLALSLVIYWTLIIGHL